MDEKWLELLFNKTNLIGKKWLIYKNVDGWIEQPQPEHESSMLPLHLSTLKEVLLYFNNKFALD